MRKQISLFGSRTSVASAKYIVSRWTGDSDNLALTLASYEGGFPNNPSALREVSFDTLAVKMPYLAGGLPRPVASFISPRVGE